jgi:PAS domain S-box-containing protein
VEMMPLHLEYRIIRADGELRYIRQVSHLQRNSAGEHILFGSTGDITEQKLLEIQLRETNEALQLRNELFAQAEDIGKMGTWQVNLNTRKTICCEHHYRLYGIKPYSVSAALENFLSFVHPDDRDIITDLYHDVYEEFVPADIDFRIIRPDGKVRTIRQRCKLIQTLENERLITGVIQDITLQEQKDRQLKESYEKLAVQNETFRQAEKVAAMGSWTWNLDTGVLSFSENMYHIYGARPQVLEPRMEALVEFIHPEDRKRLKNLPERIRKATEPLSEVYRIVRSDGEVRHLCSRSQRFTSPQGKAIIIGTLQDITEEEQLQEQSKERVAFARMLADTMVDRIIITDQSNNIVSWNKSSEQIFGRRKEEVAGKNFFDVFPQLRIPSVMDRFKQALAGQTVHVASLATITMPGYHELLMVPFKNVSGRVTGIMSVLHDVTRQHQLQQQLAERVQFSETLIDSSVDRVFSIDTEQRLLTWNSKCEEAYGLPRNKVIGKKLADVFPEAVSRPDLMEPVLKALQGETTYVPARESVYTDGMVESYFIPLKNAAGNVYGVLSIVRDVTERIRAEQYMHQLNQSLQEKNRALEEMNEELTSFAFVASHDLREPLRKIQIFSDWINQREATQLSEEGKDRFNRIRAAVHRMDTLIDDILSFSRINSNSRQLVVFDPNQVLENVKTDLNERIARSKAVIHVDPLPAMKGNPTHFYQLLLNLINNALKYQHPGNQPYVRITCERLKGEEIDNAAAEKASTYFKITVADNGIGFEPQYAKKIFQMFQRLHGMHEYPGTGMGLAICRKIMKKHRGFITAAGKPGEGAVFSCYFHAG